MYQVCTTYTYLLPISYIPEVSLMYASCIPNVSLMNYRYLLQKMAKMAITNLFGNNGKKQQSQSALRN
jgi:hypothetical protein